MTIGLNKLDAHQVTLAELRLGVAARVVRVDAASDVVHRLMEMGLVPGSTVEIRRIAPFGDPLELCVGHYMLSIRRNEAHHFHVEEA